MGSLNPSAVDVSQVEPAIVRVTMQDRAHKNMFTLDLISGLIRAFETVAAHPDYKVVILTGYDNYFATGGTREGLLGLYDGRGQFTDANFYSLALDCPIPVIAAMQGHGIGGGFVMGLFADFVLLSRESIYTTNFMKYGFTPGMGATYIIPKKLGISLGEELLLNAGNYRGADLEKRGVPFAVYARSEVPGQALQLARQIAEKPRRSLITLKDHLVAPLRAELPGFIAKEVAMHETTFHQPEVKERIMTLFGH
jgi:polyketide biosynthesis enoyl-CoA hydratase PksI